MIAPFRSLGPWMTVLRPINGLVAASAVILGAWLAEGLLAGWKVFVAAGSAFLINGFGNVVNDLVDRDIDALNRPGRPLPSGLISPSGALRYAAIVLLAGFALARAISPLYLFMVFGTALLLWLYSFWLKGTVLLGNVVVAGLTAFTLVFGALLGSTYVQVFFPALFAFLINLAREIVKDMADAEGDRLHGIRTLPVRFGFALSGRLVAALLSILILLTLVPWKLGIYGGFYLPAVILFADLPLVISLRRILKPGDDPRSLNQTSGLLKAAMSGGMLAVVLGV